MFGSLAVLVTVNSVNSFTYCVGTLISTGAVFTSRTTARKLLVADRCGFTRSYGLLFVTAVVTRFVLGLWFCCGVQVITPLASIAIPLGAPTNR